jgi:hypothetical protein
VKEIAVDVRVVDDGLTDAAAADDHVEDALGQAGLDEDVGEGRGGRGRRPGGLHDHGVAEGERRRGLPRRDGDGEVPRGDQAVDADGLTIGLDLHARADAVEVLAVTAQGLAGEVLEDAAGADRLADALWQGLAFFAREQAAQLFAALHDQGPRAVQHVGADFRRRFGPGGEGGLRGGDGGVDLGLTAIGRVGDDVVGVGRVMALARPRRVHALAVDQVGELKGVGHRAGPALSVAAIWGAV